MNVGDLIDALRKAGNAFQKARPTATLDEWRAVDIVVRGHDDHEGNDFCGDLRAASVELAHDDDETPYFALDATNEADYK